MNSKSKGLGNGLRWRLNLACELLAYFYLCGDWRSHWFLQAFQSLGGG